MNDLLSAVLATRVQSTACLELNPAAGLVPVNTFTGLYSTRE
jgi:hypothetical protein